MSSFANGEDDAGLSEHLEVTGDERLGMAETRHHRGDVRGPIAQPIDDLETDGMGEGEEQIRVPLEVQRRKDAGILESRHMLYMEYIVIGVKHLVREDRQGRTGVSMSARRSGASMRFSAIHSRVASTRASSSVACARR